MASTKRRRLGVENRVQGASPVRSVVKNKATVPCMRLHKRRQEAVKHLQGVGVEQD